MTGISHDGVQQFRNTADMCLFHGIPVWAFEVRMEMGYPVDVALTAHCVEYRQLTCCDFTGQAFPNLYAMCDYYGKSVDLFEMRAEALWNLRDILLTN
jgi:hypothetical protein